MKDEAVLFGTDGIRGKIGEGIFTTAGLFHFGIVIGRWLKQKCGNSRPSILIGHDTRASGAEFAKAIASGAESNGIKIVRVGIMTTPGLACLTKKFGIDLGIMVSASHNPWDYNGIKCFSREGLKLTDKEEQEIEELIRNIPVTSNVRLTEGCFLSCQRHYLEFLKSKTDGMSLQGFKIAMDCGNGATFELAPKLFEDLNAAVSCINVTPDGKNINQNCGSLYPDKVAGFAKELQADIGFCFDGDGDRSIITDGQGNIFDGDYIMAIIARDMIESGTLLKNTLVATQMSNIGLDISLKEIDGQIVRTDVGDKFVLDEMLKNGYNFGGEQSGHLIFSDLSTAGDGLLTAIEIMKVLKKTNKPLTELARCMTKYPQVLLNIEVQKKKPIYEMPSVIDLIEKEKEKLNEQGRIFVRYSGTEPLARIMVEGPDYSSINKVSQVIAEAIKKELK